MAPIINELSWQTMTTAVNEMKSPNAFLTNLLYPDSRQQPVDTEDIFFDTIDKGREIAPFVRRDAEAAMVGGYTTQATSVKAPNIRIKRPIRPSEVLYNRQPGTVIFQTGNANSVLTPGQQHVQRELQVLADLVTNATEWLVARSLEGTIAYEDASREVFQIVYPRSGSHNITLTTFWDDNDPTAPSVQDNVHTVKRLYSEDVGLTPTDCILGSEASSAWRSLALAGKITPDNVNVETGQTTFTTQFSQAGAIYLGRALGIDWWEYPRTATQNDTSVSMIRPKYAEFITRDAVGADRTMYFGSIPDMRAFEGRSIQAKRFSKSWHVEDPSSIMSLIHSRPLPVPRRFDAHVSMKVVSG